jgi:hypothetical protein
MDAYVNQASYTENIGSEEGRIWPCQHIKHNESVI